MEKTIKVLKEFLQQELTLDNLDENLQIIQKEAKLILPSDPNPQQILEAYTQVAVQNIKEDIDFDQIATSLLLFNTYEEVLGSFDVKGINDLYQKSFLKYLQTNLDSGLLDKRLKKYDWEKLAQELDYKKDQLLNYTGLSTMRKRYIIKDKEQKLQEVPQYLWMRLAMGLAFNEKKADEMAIAFYRKMSNLEYIPGGSTNINAGTSKPRLSNCYLMDMEDSIEHIGKTVADVLKLSKATGGIGLNVSKLRANGSSISTNNTFSSGPIPFLHIIDSSIRAISRAGKKMGALCFYMENWHIDFYDFIDLKQNAGDEYRRTRTANTAAYISDEFMRRVHNDDWWYMFDPKDTPKLIISYGQEFSQYYQEYVKQAEVGVLRHKRVRAKEQFRAMIVSLQSTSHPWLTWKDAINVRALNNNTGIIQCSNLCTEITLPQNKDNVSVCNLLSINLAKHLKDGQIDWDKLESSARLGIRQLDDLVDINEPPVPEATNFDLHNRALGMGIMGLSDILEQLSLPYDSQEAYELTDKIFEFISYMAIAESADLAQEKGSYDNFAGSAWSQGQLPIDTLKKLELDRGMPVTVDPGYFHDLDWEALRKKTTKGMRNSTVMAIAPTANIGLVAGTSPGIDPRFTQMFSRNTLSGKYLEINKNLVNILREKNLWQEVKEEILTSKGDISDIEAIPQEIRDVYRGSFNTAPEAFIEIAARAQKWTDQALSRNMYLATRDTEEIMNIYYQAWEKGLKTTYYLHMKPRHSAEQSTAKVNKSTALGKKGFGSLRTTQPRPEEPKKIEANTACPVDPIERLQCDSCQ